MTNSGAMNVMKSGRRRPTMPTYEYRCGKCDSLTILSRAVDDRDEPVSCVCGFESTRIYNAPGIQFKGTGFYKTGG
jgi:putative FmdB family regulatory protein